MRLKLAATAFRLFARRGIRGVNLDQVAAAAGVTKGSIYWHYRSKKELVLAAGEFYYRRWHRRARAEIARCDDPLRRLRRVLRFGVESCLFDRDNRVFSTEIFALGLQDRDFMAGWARFYDSVRGLFIELVEAANRAGQIRVAHPREAVDMMLAATEGIKQQAAFEPESCVAERIEPTVEGLLRIIVYSS
jgi:AcrR family transcriptional regulator